LIFFILKEGGSIEKGEDSGNRNLINLLEGKEREGGRNSCAAHCERGGEKKEKKKKLNGKRETQWQSLPSFHRRRKGKTDITNGEEKGRRGKKKSP